MTIGGLKHAVPWWQSAVIYHLYVRSFKDSNGDLMGVLRELDYLSETLGVDAVWLSPFYSSPMIDGGYDVTDHTGVDPLFGDLSLFDQLIVEAHRRDLRVILDFIPNHTSELLISPSSSPGWRSSHFRLAKMGDLLRR